MKKRLRKQLEHIQDSIRGNVISLQGLLGTFNRLSEIIDSVTDVGCREDLEITKNDIEHSIDALIENTENLFESYKNIIDNIE